MRKKKPGKKGYWPSEKPNTEHSDRSPNEWKWDIATWIVEEHAAKWERMSSHENVRLAEVNITSGLQSASVPVLEILIVYTSPSFVYFLHYCCTFSFSLQTYNVQQSLYDCTYVTLFLGFCLMFTTKFRLRVCRTHWSRATVQLDLDGYSYLWNCIALSKDTNHFLFTCRSHLFSSLASSSLQDHLQDEDNVAVHSFSWSTSTIQVPFKSIYTLTAGSLGFVPHIKELKSPNP